MGRHKSRIFAKSRLRSERLAQGWIARDFARRVGISRAALSAIELRKRGLSEQVAVTIAQVLHVDFKELFDVIPANNTNNPENEEDAIHISG